MILQVVWVFHRIPYEFCPVFLVDSHHFRCIFHDFQRAMGAGAPMRPWWWPRWAWHQAAQPCLVWWCRAWEVGNRHGKDGSPLRPWLWLCQNSYWKSWFIVDLHGFTHWTWWFSIFMLVYQRVTWYKMNVNVAGEDDWATYMDFWMDSKIWI